MLQMYDPTTGSLGLLRAVRSEDFGLAEFQAADWQQHGAAVAAVTNPAPPIYVRRGCTDPSAINYDPSAVLDDGTCNYSSVISFLVNISLNWGGVWDYDLHFQTASGEHIYYGHLNGSEFSLDHDAYPGCNSSVAGPPEVITGTSGTTGVYRAYSNLYSTCNSPGAATFSGVLTAITPLRVNGVRINAGGTFTMTDGVAFTVGTL